MKDSHRQTRSELMELFAARGIHPRSDRGQNFLIDLNLVDYVVNQARLTPQDVVLEVGAGTGGMTPYLAMHSGAVVAVEVDSHLFPLARDAVRNFSNAVVLHCDALKSKHRFEPQVVQALERELAVDPQRRIKLVANLPYSIGTSVIANLVAGELPWRAIVVTIQWELAERIQARPGTADYGALSVWLQSQCKIKILKRLPATVFWPRPKVESAVIRLLPDPKGRRQIEDRAWFHEFIRKLFLLRRKHLRSVLASMFRDRLDKPRIDAILEEQNLPAGVRAESLPVAALVALSNRMRQELPGEWTAAVE